MLLKLGKTQLKYQLLKQNIGFFIKVTTEKPPNHYLGWNYFHIKTQLSQFSAKEEFTKAYLSSFVLFVIKKGIRLVIKTTNPGIMSPYLQDVLLQVRKRLRFCTSVSQGHKQSTPEASAHTERWSGARTNNNKKNQANLNKNSSGTWDGSLQVCKNTKRNGFLTRISCELEKRGWTR